MLQRTFLLKFFPGKKEEGETLFAKLLPEMAGIVAGEGCWAFSVWQANDLVFGYYETDREGYPDEAGLKLRECFEEKLGDVAFVIASPGNMRLMYDVVVNPLREKKGLGHRVFITKLKPGTADEYKARHDRISAFGKKDRAEHPEKYADVMDNFTCWNGGDYICGYRELPPGTPKDPVSVDWEKYMLQVMDWITDDVDIVSGETHEAIRCLYNSEE